MARIAGVNIPNHKHTEIGLTAIYGVGRSRARKICEATGVPFDKKVKDLTDADWKSFVTKWARSRSRVTCVVKPR